MGRIWCIDIQDVLKDRNASTYIMDIYIYLYVFVFCCLNVHMHRSIYIGYR